MQYIIHIKAYKTCFTKSEYTLDKMSLMNSLKVYYPKRLDSPMNLHTAVISCIKVVVSI